MKLKLIYFALVVILILVIYLFRNQIITLSFSLKEKQTIESILEKFSSKVDASMNENFKINNIDKSNFEIAIIAFKKEQILELYARNNENDNWKLLKKYPFTNFSGIIGPKLKNGDNQIPEGIYQMEYLNPNSRFHLSIKVNYPNEFDKLKAKLDGRKDLGNDIMIHGKDLTIGCIPIGDENIEEVFILAVKANNKKFPIIISPQDFRINKNTPIIDNVIWENELYNQIKKELSYFKN